MFFISSFTNVYFLISFSNGAATMSFAKTGTYLVTFPIDLFDKDPAVNFNSEFELQRWDPLINSYRYHYDGIDCGIDDCIQSVEPGEAYWLTVKSDNSTLTLQGDDVVSHTMALHGGWNMVGHPYSCSDYPFQNIKFNGLGVFDAETSDLVKGTLYGFDADRNEYVAKNKESNLYKEEGYWIAALADSTMEFRVC